MENYPQILPPQKSRDELVRLLQRYPLPLNDNNNNESNNDEPMKFSYGTAGFRYDATLLEGIMVRVGILVSLLKKETAGVGVMVTASHNDESYNGVKITNDHGGMMSPKMEVLAIQLANASLEEVLDIIATDATIETTTNATTTTTVHVGRDTRSHSPHLSELLVRAARAMGSTVVSHGVVTTPMLHHVVLHANSQHLPLLIPPRPNVSGYFDLLAHSYHSLLLLSNDANTTASKEPLVVDCACGVGYDAIVRLNDILQSISPNLRRLVACNGPTDGPLNSHCGSEHVQKEVRPPKWYSLLPEEFSSCLQYVATLDGDADRIVFFSESSSSFTLLDGDKIAVLICDFLQEQLRDLQRAMQRKGAVLPPIKLGVVQTAYANGASTQYLQSIMDHGGVLIAKTGVKHVHATAHSQFDIGVYFEANGHGTVLFNNEFYTAMEQAHKVVPEHVALRRLCLLPSLINQAVGDALSDLLLVDAILQIKGWNLQTWNQLYTDLPSRQCKVTVQDRSIIETNENEMRCTSPVELQNALDAAMRDIGGRCFVRPSGTENVVRVYAEAATSQDADALASKAAQLVHCLCGGVRDVPAFPTSNL